VTGRSDARQINALITTRARRGCGGADASARLQREQLVAPHCAEPAEHLVLDLEDHPPGRFRCKRKVEVIKTHREQRTVHWRGPALAEDRDYEAIDKSRTFVLGSIPQHRPTSC